MDPYDRKKLFGGQKKKINAFQIFYRKYLYVSSYYIFARGKQSNTDSRLIWVELINNNNYY